MYEILTCRAKNAKAMVQTNSNTDKEYLPGVMLKIEKLLYCESRQTASYLLNILCPITMIRGFFTIQKWTRECYI